MLLTVVIGVSLVFAWINGFHDGGNVFATAVSSRSVSPAKALVLCCLVEFVFPIAAGTGIAATIGKGVVDTATLMGAEAKIALLVVLFALVTGIVWNLITWKFGLPSSSSHALIGGLLGSGAMAFGFDSIAWNVLLTKIILVLLVTPFIGFFVGFVLEKVVKGILLQFNSSIARTVKRLHYLSMTLLAASHSTADAQKTMGVITIALLVGREIPDFQVAQWVKVASAAAISCGLFFSGWRIIMTVGSGIFRVKPMHSLAAQLAASATIYSAVLFGGAVSTSQVVSSTIMGVGASEKFGKVRWKVAGNILLSWVITVPAAALLAAAMFLAGQAVLWVLEGR